MAEDGCHSPARCASSEAIGRSVHHPVAPREPAAVMWVRSVKAGAPATLNRLGMLPMISLASAPNPVWPSMSDDGLTVDTTFSDGDVSLLA